MMGGCNVAEPWIVFYYLDWQEMAAYTVRGAFAGELQATKELLAYEHNIPVSDITAKVEWR